MSHPARLELLHQRLALDPPALLLIFLPYLAHLALAVPQSVPTILVLEEGWERALEWTTRDFTKSKRNFVIRSEMSKVRKLYSRISGTGRKIITISREEADWFSSLIGRERDIVVIEHGVDCDFYSPQRGPKDFDVGIFGIFAKGANLEGALELLRCNRDSGMDRKLSWVLAGKNPDASLVEWAGDSISVTGYVSDMRPFYARTKVVAVPATYGGGAKTTVLQAWAMELPVVATPFALKGLPARPGENVLVSESPDQILENIQRLLTSADLSRSIGTAGRKTVLQERNLDNLARNFVHTCNDFA